MSPSQPQTWKENGGYQSAPKPQSPPDLLIIPAPIMITPMIGLACKPCMPPPPTNMIFTLGPACLDITTAPKSAAAKSDAAKSVVAKSVPANSVTAKSVAAKSVAAESVVAKSVVAKSDVAKPDVAKSVVAAKSVSGKSVVSNKSAAASVKSKASSKATCKSDSAKKPEAALPGMKYIYPKKTTCLHVIKGVKVWEAPPANFKCKVFNVGTPMTVCELIEHLTDKEGDACMGWAVTEVMEKGDGYFDKGTSIEYGCDKAATALAAIGWTEACGTVRPPVWLVLHKG